MNTPLKALVLLFGADGFSTATGVLNSASANGTYTWTLEQPTSPEYRTQLRGGFRVQSISSDGLGIVTNGWEWRLEYQTDDTWTFSWYSVTGGAPAGAELTQTNIGTVTNVRVTLNGNSISVETSANNGSSYTARGNTSSATYATETGLCSSYTGASSTLLDYDFTDPSNWSGDDPIGWVVIDEVGSDPVVTQVAGGARFFTSATAFRPIITRVVFVAGQQHIVITDVDAVTANRAWVDQGTSPTLLSTYSPGLFAFRGLTPLDLIRIMAGVSPGPPTDFVISKIQVFAVGVLDASGDGGFTGVTS